jgi:hypothetical protein
MMLTEEQLDEYRVQGTILRVIRDVNPANDVKGIILAWDETSVLIRKQNRKVLKLDRNYFIQPFIEARPPEFDLPAEEQ